MIRYEAFGYPMATQNLDGSWTVPGPDSTSAGDWGTFKVEIGATWDVSVDPPEVTTPGTDLTDVAVISSMTFGEPWGPLSAAIQLPTVTPFDAPGWLLAGTPLDIWHVLPDGETTVAYWHGFVASIELADSPGMRSAVTLQAIGAAFGEASFRAHQPVMREATHDAGQWLNYALNPASYSRPYSPFVGFQYETTTTGIDLRHRGTRGQTVASYAEEVLSVAVKPDEAWTISQAYDESGRQARKVYLRRKQESLAGGAGPGAVVVQQNTVFLGGYGVSVSLSKDYTESPNAVFGEGIDSSDSSRWRNAKYPSLFPDAPAYPDRVVGTTYPLTTGDVDADFDADVVTQLQYGLRLGGWPMVSITGEYDAATAIAVYAMKDSAPGVSPSGEITSNADWDLVWETGTLASTIDSAYFRPLSEVSEATAYTYAANGYITGTNDDWDRRIRIERVISYGEVEKERARLHARRIATAAIDGPSWVGTITLTSDPTDEDAAGRSRLDIREGSWLRLNNLDGGTYRDFYIAGVTVSDEGHVVTLTVSDAAFDLPDLAARIERNKAANEDPAKSFYAIRARSQSPWKSPIGWDKESGSGTVFKRPLLASEWNVIKFVGAQAGTIEAIKARTTEPACRFAIAVFGKEVDASDLNTLIPDPLAEEPDGYGWWSHPDNVDQLADWYHIESWGSFGQAAGYYPGVEERDGATTTHPVTGRLVDELSWQFVSDDAPYLWLAVFPTDACDFRADMKIVADE